MMVALVEFCYKSRAEAKKMKVTTSVLFSIVDIITFIVLLIWNLLTHLNSCDESKDKKSNIVFGSCDVWFTLYFIMCDTQTSWLVSEACLLLRQLSSFTNPFLLLSVSRTVPYHHKCLNDSLGITMCRLLVSKHPRIPVHCPSPSKEGQFCFCPLVIYSSLWWFVME